MGEIAFIRGDVASANVKALKKTILWRIDHATMQQYVADYSGGAQFCLNLADVLAQRVQEGNTRLIGVSQSLSAYFGQVARNADKQEIEAPSASGTADMEIPREVYDRFICETMEYPEGSELTAEHRDYVDHLVKSNEVDFIDWLEQGQKGQKLKVILKFVPLDANGNVVETHDEDDHVDTIESETATAQPGTTPQRRPRQKKSHIVSVPQVQARVKARTAVIEEKPNRFWQAVHYAACVVLPFALILTVLKFLPLNTRADLYQTSFFKWVNPLGLVERVIFQPSNFEQIISFDDADKIRSNFIVPAKGYFELKFNLSAPRDVDTLIQFKLYNFKNLQVLMDDPLVIPAGQTTLDVGNFILPKTRMEFSVINQGNKPEADNALQFTAKGRH